jgi:hypothetical protein
MLKAAGKSEQEEENVATKPKRGAPMVFKGLRLDLLEISGSRCWGPHGCVQGGQVKEVLHFQMEIESVCVPQPKCKCSHTHLR